jgi:alcohol dehydrogenase (cytochrome c)
MGLVAVNDLPLVSRPDMITTVLVGALRAIDPVTAERKWEFRYPSVSSSGVLSTASGLVFAGDGDGNILAFESRTGKNLWHYQLGSGVRSTGGTTYMLDGRQYFLVPSGSTLVAFALPQPR